ncbi:MAG TPA: hypothetical protein PLA03_10565, partial [Acidobacteriota bacterium]|nr:hypothetical protein [Acidobacteriota bacterium]
FLRSNFLVRNRKKGFLSPSLLYSAASEISVVNSFCPFLQPSAFSSGFSHQPSAFSLLFPPIEQKGGGAGICNLEAL